MRLKYNILNLIKFMIFPIFRNLENVYVLLNASYLRPKFLVLNNLWVILVNISKPYYGTPGMFLFKRKKKQMENWVNTDPIHPMEFSIIIIIISF